MPMKTTANTRRSMPPWKYNLWVGVFFLILFSVVLLVYIATIRIEYTWGWYKVPSTFFNRETIEISSDIDGKVVQVTRKNAEAVITIKNETESKSYTVPAEDVRVNENDLIYYGDTLATYSEWRAGIMLQGLWITLKCSIFAIIFGIIIGVIGGIARISDNPALKWSAISYVELIRGSPLLVQIFIWYFVLGTMVNQILTSYGMAEIPSLWYGVASLACFTGAYVTEIVRAGIQSIHRGQTEAARSLGMSYGQCMRYVILPQAMRRILPPLAGQFISLIKDSSLLGIIAVRELLKASREVVTTQLNPFEMYFTAAALYLVITFALSMFVQYLERKTATS